MIPLSEKEHTNFRIDELFKIHSGKRIRKQDQEPGNIPYITAVSVNNGIDSYIKNPVETFDNMLTVNFFGDVFYQPQIFGIKDGTYALELRNQEVRNHLVYLFLSSVIEKISKSLGSYTKMLTGNILKEQFISLPVDAEGDPDWEYMEEYIKSIKRINLNKVISYHKKQEELLDGIYDKKSNKPADPFVMKDFRIGELFEIGTGSYCPQLESGNIPRISTKSTNNGYYGDFNSESFDGARHEENFISVNFFGAAGGVFYHKNRVSLDLKVHSLKPKNTVLNTNIALYLCSAISKSISSFSYAKQLSSSKLKKDPIFITLPATESGEPDWEYMEQYSTWIGERERERVENYIIEKSKESTKV